MDCHQRSLPGRGNLCADQDSTGGSSLNQGLFLGWGQSLPQRPDVPSKEVESRGEPGPVLQGPEAGLESQYKLGWRLR